LIKDTATFNSEGKSRAAQTDDNAVGIRRV
jgi:hypothetical protein